VSRLEVELAMLVKTKKIELMDRDKKFEDQRFAYETKINQLDAEIKSLTSKNLHLNGIILEQQVVIKRYTDIESQLEAARNQVDSIDASKRQLQQELESASAYILQLEQLFYSSKKQSLDLLTQLKESEQRC
jgi:exonuclease VII small subunit